MELKEKNKIRGKKARKGGQAFERRVKLDMEKNNMVVSRWMSNVEFMCTEQKACCARLIVAKYSRFNRWTGFPDFIAFSQDTLSHRCGVECKSLGYLTKEEKEKCKWLLDNTFREIIIAKKGKKRGEIIYEKYEAKSES